jgi:DNA-binding winged helix-turn-helix (wHTH) protein
MSAPKSDSPLVFGRAVLNGQRRELTCDGSARHLRTKSFDVLSYLTGNPGRVVSKDELIEAVWGGAAVTDNSIVQCLVDIRRALEPGQEVIRTARGKGYRFDADVRPADAGADAYGGFDPSGMAPETQVPSPAPDAAPSRPERARSRWPLVAAGVALLSALGIWALTMRDPGATTAPVPAPVGEPPVAPQVTLNTAVVQLMVTGNEALLSRSQADLQRARSAFEAAVKADPRYSTAAFWQAVALASLGRLDEAMDAALRSRADMGNTPTWLVGYVHASAGRTGEAREVLRAMEVHAPRRYVPAIEFAYLHLALGGREAALSWLERALEEHSRWIELIAVDPILDPLRGERRFEALLEALRPPRVS